MLRAKKLIFTSVVIAMTQSVPAFADCHQTSDSLISQDLVNKSAQAADLSIDKPTKEQLDFLSDVRVVDLQNASKAQKDKADDAQKDLDSVMECGDAPLKITKAQCIQKAIDTLQGQLNQLHAKMELMSDDGKASSKADETKLQSEIDELKVNLNLPKTSIEASQNYSEAATTLQQMTSDMKRGDFSYKEHLTIIGKALLSSWGELLKPGPIIAVSAGMAGYGVARATSLNADSKAEYQANGPAPSFTKVTDQIGYAYPVLAPFLIVAAVTKNNETMKTFDALAVGTAISETIVEPLKYIVHEERPNGSDNLGFPSAHAAQSFMMATVLDHEYPGHHHIVGIASYAVAALVAYGRQAEGMHSPGELMAGAGIGIATGIAAAKAVDSQFDAAEGQKQAYWKDAIMGNFRVGKSGKVIHCVPMGLSGSCEMTW